MQFSFFLLVDWRTTIGPRILTVHSAAYLLRAGGYYMTHGCFINPHHIVCIRGAAQCVAAAGYDKVPVFIFFSEEISKGLCNHRRTRSWVSWGCWDSWCNVRVWCRANFSWAQSSQGLTDSGSAQARDCRDSACSVLLGGRYTVINVIYPESDSDTWCLLALLAQLLSL